MRKHTLAALAALIAGCLTLSPQAVINSTPGAPSGGYLVPGATFAIGAAAVIDSLGRIGAAQGSASNCVTVAGTSAPCGFAGTILPSQILSGGANVGQALVWNGSAYVPTNQTGTGGGGGTLATYLESTLIGTRGTYNFLAGAGTLLALSDTGTAINIQVGADTAFLASNAHIQAGTLTYEPSASASGTTYTACSASQVTSALTTGMTFNWVPDVNGSGGATTLNLCTLGATTLKLADGATNPSATSIKAGQMYTVWYDGTLFRLKDVTS